jgi:hypothetical protein
VVESVELAESGDTSGPAGMLEVSLLVSTYYVTPPKP